MFSGRGRQSEAVVSDVSWSIAIATPIPLAQAWGGGDVVSADGLRFVVPIRTLNAGPNSQYFHVERGVTYFNFASDQFTGFYGIVIPGTVHEGAYHPCSHDSGSPSGSVKRHQVASTRWRRRSRPARPYPLRLISFNR